MKYKKLYEEAMLKLELKTFELEQKQECIDRLEKDIDGLQDIIESYRCDNQEQLRGGYCSRCEWSSHKKIPFYTHGGMSYVSKCLCLRNVPCQGFKLKGEKENG